MNMKMRKDEECQSEGNAIHKMYQTLFPNTREFTKDVQGHGKKEMAFETQCFFSDSDKYDYVVG